MKIELDEGYAFGLGVFETIKVKEGRALALERHMKRLQRGLQFFGIEKKLSEENIKNFIEEQEEDNFALKLMVSEKNIIFSKRKNPYEDYEKERGLDLTISSVRRNSTSSFVHYKSLQYAENIVEKRKASKAGYDEVLFLNEKSLVCEGAVSNIFFVQGETIYTPKIEDGLLAGTMREYLIKEYEIQEISISREELSSFSSCFISNALMGILWVKSIDEISYQKTSIIKKLMKDIVALGY